MARVCESSGMTTFDEKLSGSEDDKIEAASDWVDKTCNLDLS